MRLVSWIILIYAVVYVVLLADLAMGYMWRSEDTTQYIVGCPANSDAVCACYGPDFKRTRTPPYQNKRLKQ